MRARRGERPLIDGDQLVVLAKGSWSSPLARNHSLRRPRGVCAGLGGQEADMDEAWLRREGCLLRILVMLLLGCCLGAMGGENGCRDASCRMTAAKWVNACIR